MCWFPFLYVQNIVIWEGFVFPLICYMCPFPRIIGQVYIPHFLWLLNFDKISAVWCKKERKRGIKTESKGGKREDDGGETPKEGTGKVRERTRKGKIEEGKRWGQSRKRKTEAGRKGKVVYKSSVDKETKNMYSVFVILTGKISFNKTPPRKPQPLT